MRLHLPCCAAAARTAHGGLSAHGIPDAGATAPRLHSWMGKKEGRRMTTVFANLLTSVGAQLAGVPPAALAPFLWNAVLLVAVRAAIRARDRRLAPPATAGASPSTDEFRSAA